MGAFGRLRFFDEVDHPDERTSAAVASVAALIAEQDARSAEDEGWDDNKDEPTKRAEASVAAYLRGEAPPATKTTKRSPADQLVAVEEVIERLQEKLDEADDDEIDSLEEQLQALELKRTRLEEQIDDDQETEAA